MTDAPRGRQHLRPRLPGLRRSAPRAADGRARPAARRRCAGAYGIGRGGRAKIAPFLLARPGTAAGRAGRRHHGPGRPGRRRRGARRALADPPRHVPEPHLDAGHAVLCRPGAGAVRARPAVWRAAAVLLAGPDPRSTTRWPGPAACSWPCFVISLVPQLVLTRRRHPGGRRPGHRAARGPAGHPALPAVSRPRLGPARRRSPRSSPPGRRAARTRRRRSSRVFIVPPIIVGAHRRAGRRRPGPSPRPGQPGRRHRGAQRGDLRDDRRTARPSSRRTCPAGPTSSRPSAIVGLGSRSSLRRYLTISV